MIKSNSSATKAQIVYLSHGGGPLPILGDPSHKAMVDFMRRLPTQLRHPDAILVISAHWEETAATLLNWYLMTTSWENALSRFCGDCRYVSQKRLLF